MDILLPSGACGTRFRLCLRPGFFVVGMVIDGASFVNPSAIGLEMERALASRCNVYPRIQGGSDEQAFIRQSRGGFIVGLGRPGR
jgi:hypothetical protein